jgi:hypothetical protein
MSATIPQALYLIHHTLSGNYHCVEPLADSLSLSDRRGGRYRRVHLPSQEPQRYPVELLRTMHALAWRIRYWLVRFFLSKKSVFVFSECVHYIAFLLHLELPAAASPCANSLSMTYVVSFNTPPFSDLFFLDESHLDTLSTGCEHRC